MQLKLLTRQLNSRIFKMKTNQYIILLLLIASESSSEYPSSFERLHQLEILRNGKVEIPNLVDRIKSYLFDLTSNNQNGENEVLDISDECMTHLEFWGESISQPPPGQTWPIEMLDAFSKIPEGILSGHISSYGDFDECLAVRAEGNFNNETVKFKGQHCTSIVVPAVWCGIMGNTSELATADYQTKTEPIIGALAFLMPTVGTCMPSSCSKDEIHRIMNSALEMDLGICTAVQSCKTDDKPKLKTADIIMIVILSIIAVLCIVGTAADIYLNWNTAEKNHPRSKALQCLIAFSLYTNTKKWLSTNGGGDNLGAIHGIRFLSTCWVVLGHTISTIPMSNLWNLVKFSEIPNKENWTIYPIINATIAVDTFFTMSAILMAYLLLKTLDKSNGRLNILKLYIHRYLRLTPTYALLIGIMATWYQYLRPGPLTYQLEYASESCQKNWWHNLLYINNFIKYPPDWSNQRCHAVSWYLANDMQFFLISPFLLLALWKWKLIGTIVLGGFTLASIIVPFVVTYHYKLDMTLLPISDGVADFIEKSYEKPWMRFGPYAVGLWAGYFLYQVRTRKIPIKLSKWTVLLGWLTCTATALAIIFGVLPHFQVDASYNRLASAFYAGFHRFAWGVVISWVVLACTMGYGGIINTFLSWKVFIPLGRLSFCTYLISFPLQNLQQFSMRQAGTYDLFSAIMLFFSQMIMSLLIAFVACMTLESPFMALEKILLGRDGPPKKPPVLKEPFANTSDNNSNSNSNNESNLDLNKEVPNQV